MRRWGTEREVSDWAGEVGKWWSNTQLCPEGVAPGAGVCEGVALLPQTRGLEWLRERAGDQLLCGRIQFSLWGWDASLRPQPPGADRRSVAEVSKAPSSPHLSAGRGWESELSALEKGPRTGGDPSRYA